VSKWAFDQFVRRKFPEFDASKDKRPYAAITGLRYFNVYGPGEDHKGPMTSFVRNCFTAVENNVPIELFEGSEDITRDFIYVEDAARITVHCALSDMPGIFNVGTGIATSFLDVAEEVRQHFPDVEINTVPFPEQLARGYQYHTQADIGNLRSGLGRKNTQMRSVAAGVAAYKQEFFE
jgi:ADP-L-glycero-D-manno-heptose 6-epimerase